MQLGQRNSPCIPDSGTELFAVRSCLPLSMFLHFIIDKDALSPVHVAFIQMLATCSKCVAIKTPGTQVYSSNSRNHFEIRFFHLSLHEDKIAALGALCFDFVRCIACRTNDVVEIATVAQFKLSYLNLP
jgi:hypothetical protein